jgi:hypothetical protein
MGASSPAGRSPFRRSFFEPQQRHGGDQSRARIEKEVTILNVPRRSCGLPSSYVSGGAQGRRISADNGTANVKQVPDFAGPLVIAGHYPQFRPNRISYFALYPVMHIGSGMMIAY